MHTRLFDPEKKILARAVSENVQRQWNEDIIFLASQGGGRRVLARILHDLGIARQIGGAEVDKFNYGQRLASRIFKASPEAAKTIMAEVFRLAEGV